MDIFWMIVFAVAAVGFIAWKKGLLNKSNAATPTKPNPPVFTPAPESNELAIKYDSPEILLAFIKRHPDVGMVTLDDVQINAGFPPAAKFETQIDGSVRR